LDAATTEHWSLRDSGTADLDEVIILADRLEGIEA
jgi:hypothetical protein